LFLPWRSWGVPVNCPNPSNDYTNLLDILYDHPSIHLLARVKWSCHESQEICQISIVLAR
jgi:hypothetical protein